MIKIEEVTGIDGVTRTLNQLEQEYLKIILRPQRGLQSPIVKMQNALLNTINVHEQKIIRYLIESFKQILTYSPHTLERIIKLNQIYSPNIIYNNQTRQLMPFGKTIQKCFNYDYYRKVRLVEFSELLNLKSCPYCNCQYTLTVETNAKKKKANFQYDHYFPKSRFPYLSLSMYNLIPSCANCNLSKRDVHKNLADFFHPYHNSFHQASKFRINSKSEVLLLTQKKIENNNIVFELTNKNNAVIDYNNTFNIEGIYKRHNDIIAEIYYKAKAYNSTRIKELLNWTDVNGDKIFPDRAVLNRILLGNYPLDKDIHKRPLSKFTIDIAKQAGLID